MLFEPCGELRRDYGAYCETLRLTEREDIFSQVYTNFEYEKEKERKLQQKLQWQKIIAEGMGEAGKMGAPSALPPGGDPLAEGKGGEASNATATTEGGSGAVSRSVPKLPLDGAVQGSTSATTTKSGDREAGEKKEGSGSAKGGAAAAGNRKKSGGAAAGNNATPRRSVSHSADSRKKKGSPISPRKVAETPQELPSVAFDPLPRVPLTFIRVRHPKFCLNQRDMTPLCRAIPYCLSLVLVEFVGAGLSVESYLLLTEAVYRSRRVVTVRIDFNAMRKPGFVQDPTLIRCGGGVAGAGEGSEGKGRRHSSMSPSTTSVVLETTPPSGLTPLNRNGIRSPSPRTTTTTSPVRGEGSGGGGTGTSVAVDRVGTPDSVPGGKAGGNGPSERRQRALRRRSSSANSLLGGSGATGSTPSLVGVEVTDESGPLTASSSAAAAVAGSGGGGMAKEEPGDIFLKPSEYCGLHLLSTPLEDQIQEEREKKGKVDPKKLQLLQAQQETIQRFNDQHRVLLPRSWGAMLCTAVVHLSLRGNGIGDVELGSMVHLLLRNSHSRLVSLNLWGNEITDVGAKSIALLLRHSRTLRALDVGHNHMGNSGIIEIVNTFRMIEMKSVEEIQAYRKRVLTRPTASDKERAAAQQVFSWNSIPTYQDIFNVWQAQKAVMNSASTMANVLNGSTTGTGPWTGGVAGVAGGGGNAGGGATVGNPSSGGGGGAVSSTTNGQGGEEKVGSSSSSGGGGGSASKRTTSGKGNKTKEAPPPTLARPSTPFDRECVRVTGSEPCIRVPGNTVLEVLNLAENTGVTLEGIQEVVRILSLREPKSDEDMLALTVRPRPASAVVGRRWSAVRGSHGSGAAVSSTGGDGKEEEGPSGAGGERRWSVGGGGGGGGGPMGVGSTSGTFPPLHTSPPFSPSTPSTAVGSTTSSSAAGHPFPLHSGGGGTAVPTLPTATTGAGGAAGNTVVLFSPELHCAAIRLRFCAVVHYRFSTEWKDYYSHRLGEGSGWVGVGGQREGGRGGGGEGRRVSFSGGAAGGGGDAQGGGLETMLNAGAGGGGGGEVPFASSTSTPGMVGSMGGASTSFRISALASPSASLAGPRTTAGVPLPPVHTTTTATTTATRGSSGGGEDRKSSPLPACSLLSSHAEGGGGVGGQASSPSSSSPPPTPSPSPPPSGRPSLSKARRSEGGGPRESPAALGHRKKSSPTNSRTHHHHHRPSGPGTVGGKRSVVGVESLVPSTSTRSSGSIYSPLHSHLSETISGSTSQGDGSPLPTFSTKGSHTKAGGGPSCSSTGEGGTKVLSVFPASQTGGSVVPERGGGGGGGGEGVAGGGGGGALFREAFGSEETAEEVGEWEAMSAEQWKLNQCLDTWLRNELDALKPPTQEKSSAGWRRKNH